jgi:UDP-N-acetylmuramate dehydrogenase
VETSHVRTFTDALEIVRASGDRQVIIGGGTNLIVSDDGFDGVVLKFTADTISSTENCVTVAAGAVLQDLVDFTVDRGMCGLETLAGIPGWVGAAIYGNAGAYGHSISERVHTVRFCDRSETRVITNAECEFRYRESIFKQRKEWIILSAELTMLSGSREELQTTSNDIVRVRNEKFPPTMKCAGSIFKNFRLADLTVDVPERVVREGKVPAAYFLEQVGAKGMRVGGIEIASYHANLIYNAGGGTARELCELIAEMKRRVRDRFGIALEEEVQFVGDFPNR